MKLSDFIIKHMEDILTEWEVFAREIQPASGDMSPEALRDHGKQILQAIASDINTQQDAKRQVKKSKGGGDDPPDTGSAAGEHGADRHATGFTMPQLISEYRAMRASVLRLWLPRPGSASASSSAEMIRFNEAIDQALAESAVTFSEQAARVRDTFLAILGHDLRSPLATMAMAGEHLTRPGQPEEATLLIGGRVKRSAATMASMVHDLLEYARNQLGSAMPISPRFADVEDICQAALDNASAAHPDCEFRLQASGQLLGDFDPDRLQQVFANLLTNAAQYRGKDHSVTVIARGGADEVTVQVKNFGPPIPPESLAAIFDPLVQLADTSQHRARSSTSLGLGLFISREITVAHGGTITVESDLDAGTIFTVRIPRVQVSY